MRSVVFARPSVRSGIDKVHAPRARKKTIFWHTTDFSLPSIGKARRTKTGAPNWENRAFTYPLRLFLATPLSDDMFPLYLLSQLVFNVDFCMRRMVRDHSSLGIESQCHWLRSKQNMYATGISTAASCKYWLMAVVVGFHCDVISCNLARRGVRSGAAQPSGNGGVSGVGAVTRSVWPWSLILGRGQFFNCQICHSSIIHERRSHSH